MANGKRGAQHNATTHGIFAGIFLSGAGSAEAEEFHKLLSAAREAIRPANGLEEILTEKLAMLFLRLGRLYRADLKISAKLFARVTDSLNTTSVLDPSIPEQIVRTQRDPTVDSIIRYEASLERQIHRTICQVQELRRMREIEIVAISDAKSSEYKVFDSFAGSGTAPIGAQPSVDLKGSCVSLHCTVRWKVAEFADFRKTKTAKRTAYRL